MSKDQRYAPGINVSGQIPAGSGGAKPFRVEEVNPPTATLRDRFAMAALTGYVDAMLRIRGDCPDNIKATYAKEAFAWADFMMKARG